jgi:hypothetical protein
MIRVNGGELGTPGVEVTIATPELGAASPAITFNIACEPGVNVLSPGEESWYDPSRILAKWLGGSGVGRSMNAHEPDFVRSSVLDTKK